MSLEEQLARVVVPPLDLPADSSAIAAQAEDQVLAESRFWENKYNEQKIADQAAARGQREKYANRVFNLVCAWIVAIFVLLIAQCVIPRSFFVPLSDKVLITLITSTTINLIGTLIIVLNYIFRVKK